MASSWSLAAPAAAAVRGKEGAGKCCGAALVCQQPWVLNATIRRNIVFGAGAAPEASPAAAGLRAAAKLPTSSCTAAPPPPDEPFPTLLSKLAVAAERLVLGGGAHARTRANVLACPDAPNASRTSTSSVTSPLSALDDDNDGGDDGGRGLRL